MQTMPSKNRGSLMITGIALLALVIGLIAYGANQRAKNEARELDPMSQLAEPENGNTVEPNGAVNATDTLATEMGISVTASPSTDGSMSLEANTEAGTNPAATPAITLGAVPMTHMVQPGETLSAISRMYYNTEKYAGDIESLNKLADPNAIQAGMELALPRPEDLVMVGE